MINMEAIPKFDIKSDIRFGNRFDIRIKQTTWIGQKNPSLVALKFYNWFHSKSQKTYTLSPSPFMTRTKVS